MIAHVFHQPHTLFAVPAIVEHVRTPAHARLRLPLRFDRIRPAVGLENATAFVRPAPVPPLSGGGSGGGALQGGDGAPGSGTGIPGSIVNGTTAWGIGQDDTR